MTAESSGWWTDEPADDSVWAGEGLEHGDLATGNPISGAPTGASHWPPVEEADGDRGRLALGLAVLLAERMRSGRPAGTAFVTGVGLVMRTAADAEAIARRVLGPTKRAAEITAAFAAILPAVVVPRRSLAHSRAVLRRVSTEARRRGEAAVAAGRSDASAFLQAGVSDSIAWAQARVVPQIVDGLVPHLVDAVVPRLIEGAMPEIRTQVLPIVIEDLTKDPRVRELVLEQGRGVVGEAAQQLRATTATADDRIESAFRRLVRSPSTTDETLDPQTVPPKTSPAQASPVPSPTPSPPPHDGR
jgi:hypothetical protein